MPGDIGRRQVGGCHLIEQRLEKMIIAAVDNLDIDRRVAEGLRRRQPPETGPQNDDLWFFLVLSDCVCLGHGGPPLSA